MRVSYVTWSLLMFSVLSHVEAFPSVIPTLILITLTTNLTNIIGLFSFCCIIINFKIRPIKRISHRAKICRNGQWFGLTYKTVCRSCAQVDCSAESWVLQSLHTHNPRHPKQPVTLVNRNHQGFTLLNDFHVLFGICSGFFFFLNL